MHAYTLPIINNILKQTKDFISLFKMAFTGSSTHDNKITNPLLVICGCTGTGKSDLGIELAKIFNAEIINADSMQIYHGLDIATNKISTEEMCGIKHHLIGFLNPTHRTYNVHDFSAAALKIINDIWKDKRLPIIVGGTAYYIESVIFSNNLIYSDDSTDGEVRQKLLQKFPTNDLLYEELQRIDPDAATQIHRNSSSKVIRALEIFYTTGRTKSEHHKMQREKIGRADLHYGNFLRFQNTFLINLDAPKDFLDARLFERVEKMFERGLMDELIQFHGEYQGKLENFYGLMQCIGLKEFLPYLELSEQERLSSKGKKLLEQCKASLKTRNCRYSRIQRKWFYNRILNRGEYREIPQSISLNVSHDFRTEVMPFAIHLVRQFLSGKNMDDLLKSTTSPTIMLLPVLNEMFHRPDYPENSRKILMCDVCNLEIHGIMGWEQHLQGKKHRQTVLKKNRSEQINS